MSTLNKDFSRAATEHAKVLRQLLDDLQSESNAKQPDRDKLRRIGEDINRESLEITFNIAKAIQ